MVLARKKANSIDDINKKALAYAKTVVPFFLMKYVITVIN
jgi:hypothetical protein